MNTLQFNWVLSKDLDMNLINTLTLIGEGIDKNSPKVATWILLLKKHQLITDEDKLTEKGEIYIHEFNNLNTPESKDSFNFEVWAVELHEKLKQKLLALTGKTQKTARIKTSSYSFLCNVNDLTKKLKSFAKTYKVKDFTRVEKAMLNYIDKCYKEDNWFPLIEYYIMKDGTSKLATDMEDIEEKALEAIKPKDTSNLF